MAIALLLGGLIAAPIAAWLVRHVPPRILGSRRGRSDRPHQRPILLRSDWVDASAASQGVVLLGIALVWAAAVTYSVRAYRREFAPAPAASPAGEPVAGRA